LTYGEYGMPICRFENRIEHTALVLEDHVACLSVTRASQLQPTLQQIREYQAQGYWIALLLDYELGDWLEPALGLESQSTAPRLVAHIFRHARNTAPWSPPVGHDAHITKIEPGITQSRYIKDVEHIRNLIRAGAVYQVNYTFNLRVEISGEPHMLYRRLAHQHPSAHAAYIADDTRTVLCFSPELFIQRQGNTLTCRPMKGTAPRHADPVRDALSAHTLHTSSKNRAENLMIVDLVRNDMNRVASPGSVDVPHLFTLEAYPSVWTLTSTITAQLPESTCLYDLLLALFPCGSITGAPKIAAMREIRQLEARPRGLYCGSIGWLAPNGDFSFNIAIRTLVLQNQQYGDYAVGSGIVHDSNPEEEWQECFWKARLLQI